MRDINEQLLRRLGQLERRLERLETQEAGYEFVPAQDYITVISGGTLTTSDYTGTALSVGTSVPLAAKAVQLELTVKATTVGCWVGFGPDNDNDTSKYHVLQRTQVVNQEIETIGLCAINASTARRVYRFVNIASGGTITYWLKVTGWFI